MTDVDSRRIDGVGAIAVLRRGMAASPELRNGALYTAAMALAVAGGKLLIPLLIQVVMDVSITTDGVRLGLAVVLCTVAAALVVGSIFVGKITYFRLVRTAENVLLV